MPNPFVANAEAAQYVEFYGSQEMHKAAIDRLYYGSVRHKQETLRKVEDEVYAAPPPPVRTKAQIQEHLRRLVDEDIARRNQHKAKIEQEMYGPTGYGTRDTGHLDPERESELVKRVYYDPKKRMDRRKEAVKKRLAAAPPLPGTSVPRALKEREANFRPVVHEPKPQDGKLLLVSESVPPAPTPRSSSTPAERAHRFKQLSEPLRVTPKVKLEKGPGFQLYTKYH